jgi:hypothetical protein
MNQSLASRANKFRSGGRATNKESGGSNSRAADDRFAKRFAAYFQRFCADKLYLESKLSLSCCPSRALNGASGGFSYESKATTFDIVQSARRDLRLVCLASCFAGDCGWVALFGAIMG